MNKTRIRVGSGRSSVGILSRYKCYAPQLRVRANSLIIQLFSAGLSWLNSCTYSYVAEPLSIYRYIDIEVQRTPRLENEGGKAESAYARYRGTTLVRTDEDAGSAAIATAGGSVVRAASLFSSAPAAAAAATSFFSCSTCTLR